MLVPEEDSLLPIEQEADKEIQIGRHTHYAADVKLAFKCVKLATLESHLSIMLAKTTNME